MQVTVSRLVSDSGIINPEPFYSYLTAWTSNDVLGYAASMADLHPEPKMWTHDPMDVEKRSKLYCNLWRLIVTN